MEPPREPLSPDTRALLRLAVHRARRQRAPALLPGHAAPRRPGRGRRLDLCLEGERTDPGLRTDVVAALRVQAGAAAAGEHLVWLTRPGALDLQDGDRDWALATRSAYAEAGVAAPLFVVVNRRGWRDPRSGLSRTWARVRPPRPTTGG